MDVNIKAQADIKPETAGGKGKQRKREKTKKHKTPKS